METPPPPSVGGRLWRRIHAALCVAVSSPCRRPRRQPWVGPRGGERGRHTPRSLSGLRPFGACHALVLRRVFEFRRVGKAAMLGAIIGDVVLIGFA